MARWRCDASFYSYRDDGEAQRVKEAAELLREKHRREFAALFCRR
ncbi:hypothetical protein N185_15680 [Sinorhizobium sp. GW3]|nr:hypothetical protein N185_15680 [Sinorhizobium sp. GW3]